HAVDDQAAHCAVALVRLSGVRCGDPAVVDLQAVTGRLEIKVLGVWAVVGAGRHPCSSRGDRSETSDGSWRCRSRLHYCWGCARSLPTAGGSGRPSRGPAPRSTATSAPRRWSARPAWSPPPAPTGNGP